MMKKLLLLSSLVFSILHADVEHQFAGKHFLGSYLDCDSECIQDVEKMIAAMDEAVEASGATILNKTFHVFPPNGLTLVYLLSESHASLHTYPEFNACFVDLFTCGDHCSSKGFDEILRKNLKPQEVNSRMFLRNHTVEETDLFLPIVKSPHLE